MSKAQTDIRTTSYDALSANAHGYTGALDDVLKQIDAEPRGPLAVKGPERRELLHFLGVDKPKSLLSGKQKSVPMVMGYVYGYVTFDDEMDHVEYGAPETPPRAELLLVGLRDEALARELHLRGKAMSTVKLDCGCKHNQEVWIELCVQHAKDFKMRHEAAAASCSHANRDLVSINPTE